MAQTFTVDVNVDGLDPANELYDYSFDLQFDPTVFEVLSANDGTIFDYGGNTGLYIDGTIDNTNGFVTSQSGIDIYDGFGGTDGLLGAFTFEALQSAAGSTISVENVSLETYTAASNLEPPDIDPGTLPVAALNAVNGGADVPEPGTSTAAALALAGGAMTVWRKRRGLYAAQENYPVDRRT